MSRAVAAIREVWEPATTANNLKLIKNARANRGITQPWLEQAIGALEKSASATA